MWINDVYVNEKNVVTVEPYVQDRDYGLKINGIVIEIGVNKEILTPKEKLELKERLIKVYIKEIEKCNSII